MKSEREIVDDLCRIRDEFDVIAGRPLGAEGLDREHPRSIACATSARMLAQRSRSLREQADSLIEMRGELATSAENLYAPEQSLDRRRFQQRQR